MGLRRGLAQEAVLAGPAFRSVLGEEPKKGTEPRLDVGKQEAVYAS
jgi:hypothetical protein